MTEDRNALLGVLAVKNGWAQPAEVVAARAALALHPDRTLAGELAAAGALSREREKELEALAEKALAAAGGNAGKAIAANGGMAALSAPGAIDLFIDDEPTTMRAPSASKPASLGDEDEESTKVLDWDRATRKSIENVETPPPARKK
jgi:hypothetical protein